MYYHHILLEQTITEPISFYKIQISNRKYTEKYVRRSNLSAMSEEFTEVHEIRAPPVASRRVHNL